MNQAEDNSSGFGQTTGAVSCVAGDSYHTDYDSGDSHSSLELFRESPAKYAAIRVFRTMQPDPPTPAMKVGQALHSLLLEYDKEFPYAMLGKKKKDRWSDFWSHAIISKAEKIALSKKDTVVVLGSWMAVANEPDAWRLLVEQSGYNERVFTARHLGDGMLLKCKPDRVLENGLVVDLKTVDGTVDPSSWARILWKWGYHGQAAFYIDVLNLAGQKADLFVFVAVSKDPPHEIGIYVVDEESIDQGRRENRELLERLAECRRTGTWKHEWQGKILTAGVPRWAIEK